MFDVGFTELLLLALVGLVVVGPERLPRLARTMGGYVRKAKEAWHNLKIQIESEIDAQDIKQDVAQIKSEVSEIKQELDTEISVDTDDEQKKEHG